MSLSEKLKDAKYFINILNLKLHDIQNNSAFYISLFLGMSHVCSDWRIPLPESIPGFIARHFPVRFVKLQIGMLQWRVCSYTMMMIVVVVVVVVVVIIIITTL
jgi:hypothetical protein